MTHLSKEGMLVWSLTILIVVTAICSHFNVGSVTGFNNAALPTSGWDAVTTGLSWLLTCLTFQITGVGAVLSLFFWMLLVFILVPVILIIRGD